MTAPSNDRAVAAGHTPGSWEVDAGARSTIIRDDQGNYLAELDIGAMDFGFERALIDARLIAAAPDLYEALTDPDLSEAIYAWANEKNIGRDEYARRSAKVEAMRQALSKARAGGDL